MSKVNKEKLMNHIVYMDSPPEEGEEYQWLGGYILTWKNKPATVGMRELEDEERTLLLTKYPKINRKDIDELVKIVEEFNSFDDGYESIGTWLKSIGIEVKG